MNEHGCSFEEVVNESPRAGMGASGHRGRYQTPTFSMGFDPTVAWDKALQIAMTSEDSELVGRFAAGK